MKTLIEEIDEAIGWVENEYGFVTDVLRKCKKRLSEPENKLKRCPFCGADSARVSARVIGRPLLAFTVSELAAALNIDEDTLLQRIAKTLSERDEEPTE